jgi:hypothetical protein
MAKFGDVEEIDRGLKKLNAGLRKAAGEKHVVDIGILGSEAAAAHPTGEGLTNVEIGSIHEFGGANDRPPERSFLRSTMDKGRKKYERLVQRGMKLVYEGKLDIETALGLAGAAAAGDIDKAIRAGIAPPLAESTIIKKTVAGKAGTTPLIDTGQLAGSITWAVRKANEAK